MSTPEVPTVNFIFVGGVPRSGTSLVQKILDFHPAVYGGPEMAILPDLMTTYRHIASAVRSGKLGMVLHEETAREAYREFLLTLFKERTAVTRCRYVSEKTPTNLLAFEELAEVFPEARFVWVIRDPRDVICSFRAVQERSRKAGVAVEIGQFLHHDVRTIQEYHERGERFLRTNPKRVHVVYYEDLLARPREVVSELCSFLDLEFEEQMLATERSNDVSLAIRSSRATSGVFYNIEMFDRPIDGDNTGKWKRQLGSFALHTIAAGLDTERFPSLQRYCLGAAGRPWQMLYAVADPLSRAMRGVVVRLQTLALGVSACLDLTGLAVAIS